MCTCMTKHHFFRALRIASNSQGVFLFFVNVIIIIILLKQMMRYKKKNESVIEITEWY